MPLPVEIVSFIGVAKPGYNSVSWETVSEFNCSFYSLERSEDGVDWELVGNVDGVGTSSEMSFYQMDDYVRNIRTFYYRLIQSDMDGNEHMSALISVEGFLEGGIIAYPNPSEGYFYLAIAELEDEVEVTIQDMLGTQVYFNAYVTETPFKVDKLLESGLYILTLNRKDGSFETIKLVVR